MEKVQQGIVTIPTGEIIGHEIKKNMRFNLPTNSKYGKCLLYSRVEMGHLFYYQEAYHLQD